MVGPNAKYDNRFVYLPDVGELIPGDILLTFNAESGHDRDVKQSKVIAKATRGKFSHAMICFSPPSFIEAIGSGVGIISLQRSFAHEIENVRVLRYPDAGVAIKAARQAQLEVGREYSIRKAMSAVLPQGTIARITDKGIFCSALVAQAFLNAGASEFRETPIERTTPATIEKLDCLLNVTDAVFRRALSPRNIEYMAALDGDRGDSLAARQVEITGRYARELYSEAEALAGAWTELRLQLVPSFFGILQMIEDAFESIKHVEESNRSNFEKTVIVLDDRAATLLATGELQDLMTELIAADDAMMIRNIRESFQPNPDIDKRAMENYLAATVTQLVQRRQALAKLERSRSAAMLQMADIDRRALNASILRLAGIREILGRI